MNPKVTFIVPCYKLAEFLRECVDSILAQTYADFEVLIMDDCSPDHTPTVAASFGDKRVRHIRNEPNLGHLRNYNKGIGLARGDYIWLISADDRIRSPKALERYVSLMQKNSDLGYVCCSGVEIHEGKETGLDLSSMQAANDCILDGHQFLCRKLLSSNTVLAASGMVRRKCYEQLGAFPLDMPFAGDWYLWCLFALHYNVGFFAEPMVAYRIHNQSMTSAFLENTVRLCAEDDLRVLWRLREKAIESEKHSIVRASANAIAYQYACQLRSKCFRSVRYQLTEAEFESSLVRYCHSADEVVRFRSSTYSVLADLAVREGNIRQGINQYWASLRQHPWAPKTWVKLALAHTGHLRPLVGG